MEFAVNKEVYAIGAGKVLAAVLLTFAAVDVAAAAAVVVVVVVAAAAAAAAGGDVAADVAVAVAGADKEAKEMQLKLNCFKSKGSAKFTRLSTVISNTLGHQVYNWSHITQLLRKIIQNT
ncbi:hypothetical protein GQX74_013590 [Glossina fuscipes]|nr:hypothetical protein GQX74_013590 [Glossina fuscipes]